MKALRYDFSPRCFVLRTSTPKVHMKWLLTFRLSTFDNRLTSILNVQLYAKIFDGWKARIGLMPWYNIEYPSYFLDPAIPRALRVHSWAAPFRAWPGSYGKNYEYDPPVIIMITSNPKGRDLIVSYWLNIRLVTPPLLLNPTHIDDFGLQGTPITPV